MLKEGHHLVLQTGSGTKIKDQKQVIQKNYIKAGKFQHTFILTKKKKKVNLKIKVIHMHHKTEIRNMQSIKMEKCNGTKM